jgi:uncharacterized protein HemX
MDVRLHRALLVCGAALAILLLSAMSGTSETQLVLPVMLVCTLVLGGVGYGITKQKADAAHARLDRLDTTVSRQFHETNEKLDELRDMLAEIRVAVASKNIPTKRPGGSR